MKKIISILAVCLAFTVNAQTSKVINYPFGAAQGFTAAASGTVAVTISNQMSYMSAVPTLTAATTLSLTAASNLKAGAICLVTVKTTSTEVTTLGGSNAKTVAAWNWFVNASANDYVQLMWASDASDARIQYNASPTYGPAVPSLIVTANKVG